MQHIPLTSTVHQHIPVPYLSGYIYGSTDWIEFPCQNDWDADKFLKGDFQQNEVTHSGTVGSLLQAWLYFGFMAEVMATKIEIKDFVERTDGQNFVTTERLPELINEWQDRADGMSDEKRRNEVFRIDEFLRSSRSYFVACIDDNPSYVNILHRSPSPLSPEVRLSVSVLYTTLCLAKGHIFPSSKFLPPGFESEIVKARLFAAGWCASDIELLYVDKQNHAILEGYYSSLLGKRRNPKSHVMCNPLRCRAFDTEDEKYEVKHLASCQGCGFLETDTTQLSKILRDTPDSREATIPLLRLVENNGALSIEVAQSTPQSQYVAISHVFGDGLGNPKRCALPTCQLKLLQRRANKVLGYDNAFFWIDSLCVPQQPHLRETKRVALVRMKKTYETAAVVLVLNAELEGTSTKSSPEEVLTKITTNSWFRRLWTLQEGFLARILLFQFDDGVIDVSSIVQRLSLKTSHRFSVAVRLQRSALLPLTRLDTFSARARIDPSVEDLIQRIFTLAYWRSTSHPEDEALVLSTLLGLHVGDVARIVAAPDSDKMRQLILALRRLPVNILFFYDPRMEFKNFGWCIRTFMSRNYTNIDGSEDSDGPLKLADVDESGLHLSSGGIVFSPQDVNEVSSVDLGLNLTILEQSSGVIYRIESGFWLRDADKPASWEAIMNRDRVIKMAVLPKTWPLEKEQRAPISPVGNIEDLISAIAMELSELATLGVDISRNESSLRNMESVISEQRTHDVTERPTTAALVSVLVDEGDEILARYCGVVQLSKPAVQEFENNSGAVPGVLLRAEQKWCIR